MPNIVFPPNISIEYNQPLSEYTNIHIGGPADFMAFIRDQNIFIDFYHFCRQQNLTFLALGEGTNVFFPVDGFRGCVVKIGFDGISLASGNILVAEAGASVYDITNFTIKHRLSGFEFLSGIPGTIGGAVFGNAGAYGDNVGNYLIRAKILTQTGDLLFVNNEFFDFAYRYSSLKSTPAYILQAEFQLRKGDAAQIKETCDSILAKRKAKLPAADTWTAGSWFKNIKDSHNRATPAAQLLESVGSKQTHVGDAAVHAKHANIFYNKGNATAKDMLELERILKNRVLDKFGIELQREVMYLK